MVQPHYFAKAVMEELNRLLVRYALDANMSFFMTYLENISTRTV